MSVQCDFLVYFLVSSSGVDCRLQSLAVCLGCLGNDLSGPLLGLSCPSMSAFVRHLVSEPLMQF